MVPSAVLHLAGRDMDFDKKILILWLISGPGIFSVSLVLKKTIPYSENWRAIEGLGKSASYLLAKPESPPIQREERKGLL